MSSNRERGMNRGGLIRSASTFVVALTALLFLRHARAYSPGPPPVYVTSTILIIGDTVAFCQLDGGITLLELETGKVLARNDAFYLQTSLFLVHGNILAVDKHHGALLNASTLEPIWVIVHPDQGRESWRSSWHLQYLFRDRFFLGTGSHRDGWTVECRIIDSGNLEWSVRLEEYPHGMTAFGETVVLPDYERKCLSFLDLRSGAEKKTLPHPKDIDTALLTGYGQRLQTVYQSGSFRTERIIQRIELYESGSDLALHEIWPPTPNVRFYRTFLGEKDLYILAGSEPIGLEARIEKFYRFSSNGGLEELEVPDSLIGLSPSEIRSFEHEAAICASGAIFERYASPAAHLAAGFNPEHLRPLEHEYFRRWGGYGGAWRSGFQLKDGTLRSRSTGWPSDVHILTHESDIGTWTGFSPTSENLPFHRYASNREKLIVAMRRPSIECLDRKTGESLWIYEFPGPRRDRRAQLWKDYPPRNFRTIDDPSLLEDPEFRVANIGTGPLPTNLQRDEMLFEKRRRGQIQWMLTKAFVAGASIAVVVHIIRKRWRRRVRVPARA